MLKLAAYADRLSVRPGDTIRFHASNATGANVDARLVRVKCADPNPAGPGVQLEPLGSGPEYLNGQASSPGLFGSSGLAQNVVLPFYSQMDIKVRVFPTCLSKGRQTILSWLADGSTTEFDISINHAGKIEFQYMGHDGNTDTVVAQRATPLDQWTEISVRLEPNGQFRLRARPLATGTPTDSEDWVVGYFDPLSVGEGRGTIRFAELATSRRQRREAFNFCGKIERPTLTTVDENGVESILAAWDFSRDMHSQRIIDTGPNGYHGTLVNTPTRAVTGSTWTGREMNWRHAPDQYAAIHFHDDDIDDCQWPAAYEWTVPADLKSGTYALMLTAGDATENVPFFVVPPKGRATARLAVLASTFTYTVYGNHARPEYMNDPKWQAAWKAQAAEWRAYPHNPGDHPQYGLSTYNTHSDGTGIAHASWHRPMLNMRIGYVTYPYPDIRGSGLRHFPADTHLTAWLEAKGIDYDIITDWELHHEGADLLNRYGAVLTGTHPEYHTRDMLDALTAYRDGGGRLGYLGGNGFYWKIALDPERPGHIEIRRGEGGIRAWAADPGEYYNQYDGEYGGLWRRNGRPPQALVGVGFTAQGNFVGSHYRRAPEAADPRVAWMFSGIDGDIIGDFGLSGHGAAGFELDRTDKRLGTPADAIVVARSENHPPDAPWVLVPEEQLTHLTTVAGRPHKELIRADMTFFTTAAGRGAVFSTGSITFCGSLPHNGFDNTVSTLLSNVVHRLLDPAPFESNDAAS